MKQKKSKAAVTPAEWAYDANDEVVELVSRAERGDVDAAREILQTFASTVRDSTGSTGQPLIPGRGYNLPDPIVAYMGKCLSKIGDRWQPKAVYRALNLSAGKRGRRRGVVQTSGEADLASSVLWLAHELRAAGKRSPVTTAQRTVAKRAGRSTSRVRDIYEAKIREWFQRERFSRRRPAKERSEFAWLLGAPRNK